MKRYLLHLLLAINSLLPIISYPQAWNIGNTSITFSDPDRSNRSIPTQIFYPANTGGTNVPVADGQFQVIVFGHGFVMVYSAYQFLWETLVPLGYIVALPTTEGSLSPDHLSLGLDLRFLVNKLKSEGENPSSIFNGHIADSAAIMGHSMGGGAAFLAVENFDGVSAMITFAAAETNPSAIQAAQNISVPTLVFSGSNDCVTPPPDHQIPMYNNLASPCKTFISITGGGHCYFADYNFNCAFGEAFCSPSPSISRDQQHNIILSHLIHYLDFQLKGDQLSWITFNNLLNNPSGITSNQECNINLLDLKVFLEGPFNGTGMNTDLTNNPELVEGFPINQPYHSAPWNYPGTESITAKPTGLVDWVLIELRDAPDAASANSSTIVQRKATLLFQDGTIKGIDQQPYLLIDAEISNNLFVVIRHRNHLPVLSAQPLTGVDGLFSFDFTSELDNIYGGENAITQLSGGYLGMVAGDLDANGEINQDDKDFLWSQNAGSTGYLQSDTNLDGQADNPDKNEFWLLNKNKTQQFPE
ncbi:MAG: dienelactone hydrolase family protein [Bacteroidales bacterium]|nr:dienelactone hydrolase family protein [Bacteroidales bacterium]